MAGEKLNRTLLALQIEGDHETRNGAASRNQKRQENK